MIKIIKNSVVFGFLLLTTMAIVQFALPHFWGSQTTYSRYSVNRNKIANSNVVFFGSSRTLYHVHARNFGSKTETKAYNLGIQQGRHLEVNNQIRNFVRDFPSKSEKKKIIMYELCPVEKLQPKVMHTNRIRHFWNFNTLVRSIRFNYLAKDYGEILRSSKTYLEYLFKVDFIKEYWLLNEHKKDIVADTYYGAITIPRCGGCIMNGNSSMTKTEKTRKTVFEKSKRINGYYDSYNDLDEVESSKVDFLYNEVLELQEYVSEYGYELVIVNQTGPPVIQLALYNRLKTKGFNCIDMGDPNKYPSFYSPENLFDIAHLTRKGAIKLTDAMADEFNALNL